MSTVQRRYMQSMRPESMRCMLNMLREQCKQLLRAPCTLQHKERCSSTLKASRRRRPEERRRSTVKKQIIIIIYIKDFFLFIKESPALEMQSVSRRTLQTYLKRTQKALRLRTIICGLHKVLFLVGFQPTTLSTVNKLKTKKIKNPLWKHLIEKKKIFGKDLILLHCCTDIKQIAKEMDIKRKQIAS